MIHMARFLPSCERTFANGCVRNLIYVYKDMLPCNAYLNSI